MNVFVAAAIEYAVIMTASWERYRSLITLALVATLLSAGMLYLLTIRFVVTGRVMH